ncbi:unnamed protein product [Tilletia controversa]|nr:unnamed protein product [Tilletia controversa]
MAFHGHNEEHQQLDYQTMSRGGPSFHDSRMPPYEPTEAISGYSYDGVTGNVLQPASNYSMHHPPSGLYPHQQLQQQQQYWPSDSNGSASARGHGMDHELARRASSQVSMDYPTSSGEASSSSQPMGATFQHPLMDRNSGSGQHSLPNQQPFPQFRIGQDPYSSRAPPPGSRPLPVSLRQQVLTPTFAHQPHFLGEGDLGGPAPPVGRMISAQESGNIMMARSSSMPALYGQHQHGLEYRSPALSVDTAATFAGPLGRVFDDYSRPDSSSTAYHGGSAGNMYSPDPMVAAAAAAAVTVAGSMGDMSYDTSNNSYDSSMSSGQGTAMTSLPSANTTFCDTSVEHKFSHDQSFGMVMPSPMGHHMAAHLAAPRDLYENRLPFPDAGPYGPSAGNENFVMGYPTGYSLGPHNGQTMKSGFNGTVATMVPAALRTSYASVSDHDIKRSAHRPTLLPVEGSKYSIDSLLEITRAAEADPSVFPCPFCDKSYEGKHARSIWRRHLQDKHAIPLSAQPRRTRWDSDANRPKNAEERRQRMLESKRKWAQKRRRQKHLEAEAKAAAAAAAAAVAEAENSNMDEAIIEQMRAWYEHAKAQVLDFTTVDAWNPFGGEVMSGAEGGDSDGEDPDIQEQDEDEKAGLLVPVASTSKVTIDSGSEQKALTPGRPALTLAEASGIPPESPFALPTWLDQQPPSLRAAALAAIQAQRAEMRQRKTNDGSETSKSASRRKNSATSFADRPPVMARTLSLPVLGERATDAEGMQRTASQQHQQKHGSNSASSWDPFLVPALPIRPLAASPSEASSEPELQHRKAVQYGGRQRNSLQPLSALVVSSEMQAQGSNQVIGGPLQAPPLSRRQTSPYHHIGGMDHSPTPAGKRAAARMPSGGLPPMMSSSSLSSSPVGTGRAIRAPFQELANGVQGTALALRHTVSNSVADQLCSSSSASPTFLGAAIALGARARRLSSAAAAVPLSEQSNPFLLDKHKITPSRSAQRSPAKRLNPLSESPRPLLYSRGRGMSSNSITMTSLIPSPSFGMGRQLPPLPGLNERSLGWGDDPMMLGGSSNRRADETLEFGGGMDTPMRLFGKGDVLPFVLGTPRSRNGRQREQSAATGAVAGNTLTYNVNGNVVSGSLVAAAQVKPATTTISAHLATPDRYTTRPRGLSSALRNLGGTPSAGLRFNASDSPGAANMIGTAPSSTSKSWGALSSAMLDWPTAGGVELSPIRPRMLLGERRDGGNVLHFGSGQYSKPGSPGSGFTSGVGSPVLRPTTMGFSLSTSGLSALGAALTRPRGLSSSLLRGGPVKRGWDAENTLPTASEAIGHEMKRPRA